MTWNTKREQQKEKSYCVVEESFGIRVHERIEVVCEVVC